MKALEIIKKLKEKNPNKQHPRIMVEKDTFIHLKVQIEKDELMCQWYQAVEIEAEQILQSPIKDGMGIAMKSKISGFFRREIPILAMMYNLTGQEKYALRAWKQLDAGAKFDAWHPANTVETASMSAAFAIAYDWLYDYWNEEQKSVIRKAIVEKALALAYKAYKGEVGAMPTNWVTISHNWNLVLNGGFGMAALAIGDEEEALAGEILEFAIKSLEYPMPEYAPDGAWTEGVGYWKYGLNLFVSFMSALETSIGTNLGFIDKPGISKTGYFPCYMTGPCGGFNFHDGGTQKIITPELFYLAKACHDPNLSGLNISMMDKWGIKGGVEDLIWYDPQNCNTGFEMPLDSYFRKVETATFRSNWQDPEALFAGIHGGDNLVNHGDLDIGTFVIDALGQRWAEDLGSDDYTLPGYFDVKYTEARWTYYRKRAEGQNTLVINPYHGYKTDQDTKATSKVEKFVSKQQGGFAIIDMNKAYCHSIKKAKRGLMLFDNRTKILIQDEVETKIPSEIYWFMHTKADIIINDDGKSAILKLGDKTLLSTILGTEHATFSVMDAKPLPSSPNPDGQNQNDDIKKLTIHFNDVEKLKFAVLFVPMPEDETSLKPIPNMVDLDRWNI